MKKMQYILMATIITFSFMGCGSNQVSNGTTPPSTESQNIASSERESETEDTLETESTMEDENNTTMYEEPEIVFTIEGESTYTIVNNLATASLSIIEVAADKSNITVEYSYTGENSLLYGKPCVLEILKDDTWYNVKDSINAYTDEGYGVESGQTRSMTYNLSRFGTLPTGHYRVVLHVIDYVAPGKNTFYELAAEFDIE